MDLVSREVINNLEKSDTKGSDYDRGWNDALCAVDMLPSPFEGMTVGEVLKAVLGIEDEQIVEAKYLVSIYPKGNHYDPFIAVKKNVWNAPYKAESEDNED